MSFLLTKEHCQTLADTFSSLVKGKRLDGSPIPVTLKASAGQITATVRPDTPRVTALTKILPQVEGEGQITVEGTRFVEMCRRVTQPVAVSLEGENVVRVGNWTTNGVPLPAMPTIDAAPVYGTRSEFIRGLSTVKWAVSTDVVRPRLTIARFANGFVRASDGLRYCECRVDFEPTWDVSGFLVPMLRRYFESSPADLLTLSQDGQYQEYGDGDTTMIVPRPSAEYLDLDALVAEPARAHNNFILRTHREDLMAAVKDAAVMADSTSTVALDLASDSLLVWSQDGQHRAEITVPCRWDGEPRRLKFFVGPLLQLLRTSSAEVVELRLGTSTLRKLTPLVLWEDGVFSLINQVRSGG